MTSIVQTPDPVLRKTAEVVDTSQIQSTSIQDIIVRMSDALADEHDGVAIAAPQIGVSMRIFVMSKKVSKKLEQDVVFINPEIVRIGKIKEELSEGCLSVRWKYGLVKRAASCTVRAYNERGNEFVMSGRGLVAQIFQHEIDHLNGVLFIDKARNIEDIPPEKQ